MLKAVSNALRKTLSQRPNAATPSISHASARSFFAKRSISWFPKEALPILPQIALPHKWIKAALDVTRHQLPGEFVKDLDDKLTKIRAIHWNGLEEYPLYPNNPSYRSGIYLLQELLQFESKLPGPLIEALSKVAERDVAKVFDFIREGIKSIEFHRQNPDLDVFRSNRGGLTK